MHVLARYAKPVVNATISADAANVSAYTVAGSPSVACDATITIGYGIWVYSSSTAFAAMDIGTGWPVGSTIKIVNLGYIAGAGGDAGDGAGSPNSGDAGLPGGPALYLNGKTITFDNTNGMVLGGGDGGRGGNGSTPFQPLNWGGGGGGGGQGRIGGAHGDGAYGSGGSGLDGTDGDIFGAGAGGYAGGGNSTPGDPGMPWGSANAVVLAGGSITWLGGFNDSQVRGAVS